MSRVDSFIPPPQQTVLPTKTQKVPVKKTEEVTVTVTEKKDLTLEEREAKAKDMGIVVPLGLRSPTARRACLNMRRVPTQVVTHVRKQKKRTITTIVEKKEPRKIVVRGAATGGYNYASNANQTNIDIIADSINSENANILVLIPACREEDTVSLLFGSTGTRYAGLNSSSFDALNGSVIYTRLLGRKQTMNGLNTSGTASTDILTIGLDGTAVYEPGFGAEQISIATPSIGWSRSNIGLGSKLCGGKGSESYCYYADVSVSLGESVADVQSQTNTGRKSTLRSAGARRSRTFSLGDRQHLGRGVLGLSGGPPGSHFYRHGQFQLALDEQCDAKRRCQVHATNLFAFRPRLERRQCHSSHPAQYEVLLGMALG